MKSLLSRRRRDQHYNACERASKALEALDTYFKELERRDPKLKRLLEESDRAEAAVRDFR